MATLVTLARFETWAFFAALVLIVAYRMLTGQVSLAGLLRDEAGEGHLSPVRIQLFVVTLVGVIVSFGSALTAERHTLTLLPPELLILLGGSQLIYLAGKFHFVKSAGSREGTNRS